MNEAIEMAIWLEDKPSTYSGVHAAAAMIRSQEAEIKRLHGELNDQVCGDGNTITTQANEIERLHDELKQMECDDVGILRTENQNLKEVLSMQQSNGAELLDLRVDNQKLRDALKEYGRAGVGNSTDWRIQISALQMATEILGEKT